MSTKTDGSAKHAVTIKGAEVSLSFPSHLSEGDIAEVVSDIEGMIDNFAESTSKGRKGAEHYFSIVTKYDPDCKMGHSLYYQDYVKELKDVVRASANVTEQAISQAFSKLREDLDPGHAWYLDPNRTEASASGGVAKGTARKTSVVNGEGKVLAIEDPDAFTVESLVTALNIRLKNLDPSELKNAVGFITDLEDLKDTAIPAASGLVHGFIRSGGVN